LPAKDREPSPNSRHLVSRGRDHDQVDHSEQRAHRMVQQWLAREQSQRFGFPRAEPFSPPGGGHESSGRQHSPIVSPRVAGRLEAVPAIAQSRSRYRSEPFPLSLRAVPAIAQSRVPAIDCGRANTIRPFAVVSTLVT